MGGESKGESNGAFKLSMPLAMGGSKKLLAYEEFLETFSEGGVEQGKQVAQSIGCSCVQRMDVGPWTSQKCAREICT